MDRTLQRTCAILQAAWQETAAELQKRLKEVTATQTRQLKFQQRLAADLDRLEQELSGPTSATTKRANGISKDEGRKGGRAARTATSVTRKS